VTRGASLWIITRKHPPAVGGMERLSYEVARRLARRRPVTLVRWGRTQAALPLFVAWAALRLAIGLWRGQVSALLLGDPLLCVLGRLADRRGVPVVVVAHGLDLTWPPALYQAYLRRFLKGPRRAFVAISRHVLDLLVARGVAANEIVTIPVGIDVPRPAADDTDPGGPPTLLFIGRLVARKGATWFAETVMPALAERCPDVRLIVIGDGPMRGALLRAAANAPSSIEWIGAVDENEKWQRLAACDAVVMPNIPRPGDVEGFGIVALEAGAAARPVFAGDLEGLRDAVIPGCNGWRLPPGDHAAWSDALASALADRAALRAHGHRARECVLERFTWDAIARRYEAVLDRVSTRA
jgi:phosphatidylinositol alpha-1,6-mannosyltransferase